MTLDFMVLEKVGMPEWTVPLGLDAHYQLMALARQHDLALFLSCQSYHGDAEIPYAELALFLTEIETLRLSPDLDSDLAGFLEKLAELVIKAQQQNFSVKAIAD